MDRAFRKWLVVDFALFVCMCMAGIVAVELAPESQIALLRQLVGIGGESAALEYAPANTRMVVAINTNLTQLNNLSKLNTLLDNNPALAKRVNQSLPLAGFEGVIFDFQRDVVPWLGADAALIELSHSIANAPDVSDAVIVISTRDKAKSDEMFTRLRNDASLVSVDEHYQGITIVRAHSVQFGDVAYATNENQVLIARNADALKQAIDAKRGGVSVRSSAIYWRVLAHLPQERVATIYSDAPAAQDDNGVQGIGAALSLNGDGLRADYAIAYDTTSVAPALRDVLRASESDPSALFERLPPSTLLAVSANNLSALWQLYRTTLNRDPQSERNLAQWHAQWGIDLDEDVFGWLTGPYAVCLLPAKPLRALDRNAPSVGVLLVSEVKDAHAAQQKMDKLTAALAKQGVVFARTTISQIEMQQVKGIEAQGVTFGYGFVDNQLVVGSSGDVLAAAVAARSTPLSQSAEFQPVMRALAPPRSALAFVALPQLLALIKPSLSRAQLTDFETNTEPLLSAVKSVSISAGISQDDMQTGTLFIHLGD